MARLVNDNFDGHTDELSAVITENKEYGKQVRMTVSEFMGNHYLGIREYYLDFDEEWKPTRNGMSFPYNLDTTTNMFQAFTNILSRAEVIAEVFKNSEAIENNNKNID